jgi:hypothetical protein
VYAAPVLSWSLIDKVIVTLVGGVVALQSAGVQVTVGVVVKSCASTDVASGDAELVQCKRTSWSCG